MKGAKRAALLVLGLLCVGLGVLGAFLPVLPTTPFLLVSLWAFSSSSRRLEAWLLSHKRFGARLVAWRTERVIPLAAKLTAWGSMLASLTFLVLVSASWIALAGAGAVMAIGAIYIARCPSQPAPLAARTPE